MLLFRELLALLLVFTAVGLGQMIGQYDRSKTASKSLLKKYLEYATNKENLKKEIGSFFYPKPFYSKNSIDDYGGKFGKKGNGLNDFQNKPSSSKWIETSPVPQHTMMSETKQSPTTVSSKPKETSPVLQHTQKSATKQSSMTPSSKPKESSTVPESTPIKTVTEEPPSSPPVSSPCQTPEQWEGRASEWDNIAGVNNRFNITFDGINRRKRILEDKHTQLLGKSIYEYIMLYDEGIQYVINHNYNTCTVEQLGTWRNFTIPSNATFEESNEIAGSGPMVQEWSDRIPGRQKESWIGTFTYPGCLPVNEIFTEMDEHHTTVQSRSTKFFDIRTGITNISVFIPPSLCKDADATSSVNDTDQTNVDKSGEGSGDEVLEWSGDGSGEWPGEWSGEGSGEWSDEGSGDEVLEWSGDGSGEWPGEWSGEGSGEWSGEGSGEGAGEDSGPVFHKCWT